MRKLDKPENKRLELENKDYENFFFKKSISQNSLAVWWLGLGAVSLPVRKF